MLIKVKLAMPRVQDPRIGEKAALVVNTDVWINPDEIVSVQSSAAPGRFGILLKNGMTMPCEGDAEELVKRVNGSTGMVLGSPKL